MPGRFSNVRVGNAISEPYFQFNNLGTITSTWTFDYTSSTTALQSLLPGVTSGGSGLINANASTASASDHTPTTCGANLFTTGVTTTWAAVCSNLYYQTVASNGTAVTQRTQLNFSSNFVTSDSSSTGTGIDLLSVGTAGTYASPTSITTDSKGRVTSVTAASSTLLDYYFTFTGCTLNVTGNSTNCRATQAFSSVSPTVSSIADTNYYITCAAYTNEDWGTSMNVNTAGTTSFTYVINVDRYNSVSAVVEPTVWCHLHHN